MNVHEYQSLLSEQAELRRLLATRSPGNVIGRISLEWRLEKVQSKLAPYEELSCRSDGVRLLFGGVPVQGDGGVWAGFGGRAVSGFAEAVAVAGSSLSGDLAEGGPVPRRERYRLAVTGVVPGGYELEDASRRLAREGESTPVGMAIDEVNKIIAASAGSDDALADAVVGGNRRAIGAVRDFLRTVADAGAVCGLEFRNDVFRFDDNWQVRRSVRRLHDDNIVDGEAMLAGCFAGFLPDERLAEFRVTGADGDCSQGAVGQLICGRVERPVAECVDINGMLEQPVRIKVGSRRVGGSRPRYVVRWVSGMETAALDTGQV